MLRLLHLCYFGPHLVILYRLISSHCVFFLFDRLRFVQRCKSLLHFAHEDPDGSTYYEIVIIYYRGKERGFVFIKVLSTDNDIIVCSYVHDKSFVCK